MCLLSLSPTQWQAQVQTKLAKVGTPRHLILHAFLPIGFPVLTNLSSPLTYS